MPHPQLSAEQRSSASQPDESHLVGLHSWGADTSLFPVSIPETEERIGTIKLAFIWEDERLIPE